MTVYMHTTRDKYSLPLAVADSIRELAQLTHVPEANIEKCMRTKRKSNNRTCWEKVVIDDEEIENEIEF